MARCSRVHSFRDFPDYIRSIISSDAHLAFFFKTPWLKRFLESLCYLLGRMFSGEVRHLQTPAAKISVVRYIVNGQADERLHGTARPQVCCSGKVFQLTQLLFNLFAEPGIQFCHLCFCKVSAAWHLVSWISSSDLSTAWKGTMSYTSKQLWLWSFQSITDSSYCKEYLLKMLDGGLDQFLFFLSCALQTGSWGLAALPGNSDMFRFEMAEQISRVTLLAGTVAPHNLQSIVCCCSSDGLNPNHNLYYRPILYYLFCF